MNPEGASMLRSMTGFGQGHAFVEGKGVCVRVEIRALNHRHLDIRVRAEEPLFECTSMIEERVRKAVIRGRVDVSAWVDGLGAEETFDWEMLGQLVHSLKRFQATLGIDEPIGLGGLLALPILQKKRISKGFLGGALREALDMALGDLDCARVREGSALQAEIESRLCAIERLTGQVVAKSPLVAQALRARWLERTKAFLEGLSWNRVRLEEEAAAWAERLDISEECTRIQAHVAEIRRTIKSEKGEGIGKRLEFLGQELLREANTMGQKSADPELIWLIIDLKQEIEAFREQVQNLL
ncbi:MAG: YicC/YloC family endoribonuclease [Sandaracinaceae bacterium]|nr:YicC/YloC family endoribonuclease [Sandaracinaceae bacterium]